MTNREIFERAIQKAIDGGWPPPDKTFHVSEWLGTDSSTFDNPTVKLAVWFDVVKKPFVGEMYHATDIIFNHDFAKALWGNEPFIDKIDGHDEYLGYRVWERHLMRMVIVEDPIKYIGENI